MVADDEPPPTLVGGVVHPLVGVPVRHATGRPVRSADKPNRRPSSTAAWPQRAIAVVEVAE